MMRLEKPGKRPSFFPLIDTDAWDEEDAHIVEAVRAHGSIRPCSPAPTSEPFRHDSIGTGRRHALVGRRVDSPICLAGSDDGKWQVARELNIMAAKTYGHWPTRLYRTEDPHVWVEVLPHGHRSVDLRYPRAWLRENPAVHVPILFQAVEIAAARLKK